MRSVTGNADYIDHSVSSGDRSVLIELSRTITACCCLFPVGSLIFLTGCVNGIID